VFIVLSTVSLAEPTVSIITDKSSYKAGDTMMISVAVQNSGETTSLDLCIGMLMPDGAIFTLGQSGWSASITPWAPSLRMPTGFEMTTHFYYDLPSTEPALPLLEDGAYSVAALCLQPGSLTWASNLGLASFSYSSEDSLIKMLSIDAGSFLMGGPESEGGYFDERPQHTVSISAFSLSETEITQKQWLDVMGSEDSHFNGYGDSSPVDSVTWFDCIDFCNTLSQLESLPHCYEMANVTYESNHIKSADVTCDFEATGYRLPTEAEWEYACRANTTTRFHSGDSDAALDRVAWANGNSEHRSHAVGEREPNAWGFYDMHGNVWEWCWDWYLVNYYASRPNPDIDPTGHSVGDGRVMRGGSFSKSSIHCRSAVRSNNFPAHGFQEYGLRVARSSD